MPILFNESDDLFAVPPVSLERASRKELGKWLYTRFGEGPFFKEAFVEIQRAAVGWYEDRIKEILEAELETAFYQGLMWLHEMALKYSRETPNQSPIPQYSDSDFALYSRTLRLFLEFACELKLKGNEIMTLEYLKSKESRIDQILVLGQELFRASQSLSSNKMVLWGITIQIENQELYLFQNEYYQRLNQLIRDEFKDHRSSAAVSDKDLSRLSRATKESFNVYLPTFYVMVKAISSKYGDGPYVPYEWNFLPDHYAKHYAGDQTLARQFFEGLTLGSHNKLGLADSVYRSSSLNRMVYRPALIWNVEGTDLIFIGSEALLSAFMKLGVDAVGWRKLPTEWEVSSFRQWVEKEAKQNDKVLEDEIETKLKTRGVVFDRNVTKLKKWNNHGLSIENKDCGEIDFILIHQRKIVLCEAKHLIGSYDMNSQYSDYQNFVLGKGKEISFNANLRRKLDYLSQRLPDLEEHFQVVLNDRQFRLKSTEFEGLFVINTQTHVMYANEFKIYNLDRFEKRLSGEDWPILLINMNEGRIIAEYPYYRKPFEIDFEDDGGPVDEYGFPLSEGQ